MADSISSIPMIGNKHRGSKPDVVRKLGKDGAEKIYILNRWNTVYKPKGGPMEGRIMDRKTYVLAGSTKGRKLIEEHPEAFGSYDWDHLLKAVPSRRSTQKSPRKSPSRQSRKREETETNIRSETNVRSETEKRSETHIRSEKPTDGDEIRVILNKKTIKIPSIVFRNCLEHDYDGVLNQLLDQGYDDLVEFIQTWYKPNKGKWFMHNGSPAIVGGDVFFQNYLSNGVTPDKFYSSRTEASDSLKSPKTLPKSSSKSPVKSPTKPSPTTKSPKPSPTKSPTKPSPVKTSPTKSSSAKSSPKRLSPVKIPPTKPYDNSESPDIVLDIQADIAKKLSPRPKRSSPVIRRRSKIDINYRD